MLIKSITDVGFSLPLFLTNLPMHVLKEFLYVVSKFALQYSWDWDRVGDCNFHTFLKFRAIIAYNLGKYFQWFLNTIEYYPKYKYAL